MDDSMVAGSGIYDNYKRQVNAYGETRVYKQSRSSSGWVINKKTKWIIMLEFKLTSDTAETYYSDMKSISERHDTPILEGLNVLSEERGWVAGHRSVRKKE